ncbi:patatin-like phospholipase family protein [Bremerella sp. T1]|uniref:patatin-like phospholipase family protein n=1 Tax=Bremerella sp. TYQ1 TaxID=3119568 RepID=UPI001CCADBA9|nr:patatin-like phospholipase family protein [Bremerella volcania]UBM38045.1 hypothetical protein LA756_09145 [Bremerella volcania]
MVSGNHSSGRNAERQKHDSWRQQLADFLNISSGCRFSIMALILLATIVPVSRFALPLLLENGLLLDGFTQAILASFSWYVTTAMLFLQIRIALAHGPERFTWWNELSGERSDRQPRNLADLMEASHRRGAGWPAWLWLLWVLFPMPALTMVADFNLRVNNTFITVESLYGGFLAGGLLATVALMLLSFLRKYVLPGVVPLRGIFPFECLHHLHDNLLDNPDEVAKLPRGIAVLLARVGLVRGPGYSIRDPKGVERPLAGHLELALLLFLLLVITFGLGIFEHVLMPGNTLAKMIPTVGHFALMVAILSTFTSGMAFWLDRFRASTILAAMCLALALFLSRDYEFEVQKSPTPGPTLVDSIAAKQIPRSRSNDPRERDQRTLIVVTAPGGGIHASAWSAEVLTRLDERWPGTFRKSLGLISSVSGGSVGSMYYMDAISSEENPVSMEEVRERSKSSTLEPIFFAATFHDLLPLTPFDRGHAAEHFWDIILRTKRGDSPTLGKWGELAGQGKLPVMVFNATDVKSGRRVLLGSTAVRDQDHVHSTHDSASTEHTCAYDLRQSQLDMKVATAVRLSASFPYVTPISRPAADENGEDIMPAVRMGDGAYADNDGIMTALESVNQLIDKFSKMPPEQRPFDRILMINIDNYGTSTDHVEFAESGGKVEALSYATLGPLLGLSNVRGASQAERGRLEVSLLKDRTVTEQEVMWVLRQFGSRRGRGPSTPKEPSHSEMAGHLPISKLAEQKAMQRMSRLGAEQSDNPSEPQPGRERSTQVVSRQRDGQSDRWNKGPGLYPIQFQVVSIPYMAEGEPPLSWKLSAQQMRTYTQAWKQLEAEAEKWEKPSEEHWDEEGAMPPLCLIEQWLGPPGEESQDWSLANRPDRVQTR